MTGGYANVGWLQELPKQVTNLSWDNAALMSLDTMDDAEAGRERTRSRSALNGRKVIAPVLMVPGHPDGVITVHLGFGRGREGGPRGRREWVSTRTCCGHRMRLCMRRARR